MGYRDPEDVWKYIGGGQRLPSTTHYYYYFIIRVGYFLKRK